MYGYNERDANGRLKVSATSGVAEAEARQTRFEPLVQFDAVRGLISELETFTATGGSVSVANDVFICASGTSLGGYGVLRAERPVGQHPGQASLYRFDCALDVDNATTLSLQLGGAFNSGSGVFIGYDGASLGVMHRTNGLHEIRRLTVTGAAGGGENLTLTLNGVGYTIPLTAGTAAHNAYEIEAWLNANQSVWDAQQNGDTVNLFGRSVGPLSGSYSFSSATATGSISQLGAGQAVTETWTYRADWDDRLDSTGTSGVVVDFSQLNNYEIKVSPGASAVTFLIASPIDGEQIAFHRLVFGGAQQVPTFVNPALKVGWVSASLGSSGVNLQVRGSYGYAAADAGRGERHPASVSVTNASIGTTLESVVAIRVRNNFGGSVQLEEVIPLAMRVSNGAGKSMVFKLLLNPTFSSETNWSYYDESDSIVEIEDTTGLLFSDVGRELVALTPSGNDHDWSDLTIVPGMHLSRGDVLCIAAFVTSGSASDGTASIAWNEG